MEIIRKKLNKKAQNKPKNYLLQFQMKICYKMDPENKTTTQTITMTIFGKNGKKLVATSDGVGDGHLGIGEMGALNALCSFQGDNVVKSISSSVDQKGVLGKPNEEYFTEINYIPPPPKSGSPVVVKESKPDISKPVQNTEQNKQQQKLNNMF